jgi:HlyD family secretion protein
VIAFFAFRKPAAEATFVVGNGSIEGTEIVLNAKVPGRLSSVDADEGSVVQSGAILARIESDDVLAKGKEADAQITAARALVVTASNNITELQHQATDASLAHSYAQATTTGSIAQSMEAGIAAAHGVHAANAALDKARSDLARMKPLYHSGDISAMQYDAYRSAFENASAQRDEAVQASAQAQTAILQAQAGKYQVAIRSHDIGSANDRIHNGQTAVEVALAQLQAAIARREQVSAAQADTIMRAPSSGTILRVISHVGEVVAAGAPVLTMADLQKLYVRAYVSEKNVARIRVGDSTTVTVDAYPNQVFAGRVASVDQTAQFTPETVHMPEERTRLVYGIRIALVNPQGFLKPGMVADARLNLSQPTR